MPEIYWIILISSAIILFLLLILFRQKNTKEISSNGLDLLQGYVSREIYNNARNEIEKKDKIISENNELILRLNRRLIAAEESNKNLREKIETEKRELENLQKQFTEKFENIASKLFDEKSRKFTELNEKKISGIIAPFKERLTEFKNEVESLYKEESKEVISLKVEIKNLVALNQQISKDADNLTKALKGDPKVQGDWGEVRLEMVLEKAGLEKNIHYRKQEVFTDSDSRKKRPDFIINLPENRNIIIDSKVSLTAYERYFNTEDEKERATYLKEHLKSISDHISDLSKKNYQSLYEINSPDYILMFMPLESALILALKENPKILEDALDRNIVFVTTSTLLATLRTVSYLWKHEKQKKNVNEIARQGGALYDKFVNFLSDLNTLGEKLDSAKSSYNAAMNKLSTGGKRGDTIIGRVEKLKELGANASKSIPENFKD